LLLMFLLALPPIDALAYVSPDYEYEHPVESSYEWNLPGDEKIVLKNNEDSGTVRITLLLKKPDGSTDEVNFIAARQFRWIGENPVLHAINAHQTKNGNFVLAFAMSFSNGRSCEFNTKTFVYTEHDREVRSGDINSCYFENFDISFNENKVVFSYEVDGETNTKQVTFKDPVPEEKPGIVAVDQTTIDPHNSAVESERGNIPEPDYVPTMRQVTMDIILFQLGFAVFGFLWSIEWFYRIIKNIKAQIAFFDRRNFFFRRDVETRSRIKWDIPLVIFGIYPAFIGNTYGIEDLWAAKVNAIFFLGVIAYGWIRRALKARK